jgi:hypothetical protein
LHWQQHRNTLRRYKFPPVQQPQIQCVFCRKEMAWKAALPRFDVLLHRVGVYQVCRITGQVQPSCRGLITTRIADAAPIHLKKQL